MSALPSNWCSAKSMEIVKSTAPLMQQHGYAIVTAMYERMFTEVPELKDVFNMTHQLEIDEEPARQRCALAQAVYAWASFIDQPKLLGEAVKIITSKHCSLSIQPEQYAVVKKYLLGAVVEVLGDAVSREIFQAWSDAYDTLAYVLITTEDTTYKTQGEEPGGWKGWKSWVVSKKIKESDCVYSFYLKPHQDPSATIPKYQAGQYIGLRLPIDGQMYSRNYTVSCKSNADHLRISVTKVRPGTSNAPPGRVSTHLHDNMKVGDTVEITHPTGSFLLPSPVGDTPLVFISAGIGITPFLAMIEDLVAAKHRHPIFCLSVNRTPQTEVMHDYLVNVAKKNFSFRNTFLYTDECKEQGILKGPLSKAVLEDYPPSGEFYLSGPPGFMQAAQEFLEELEIPAHQIHREEFGPMVHM